MGASHPKIEAIYQVPGKPGLAHLGLGGSPVVLDAAVLDGHGSVVNYGVAGSNIAVPWLSDAARVDDAAFAIEGDRLRLRQRKEQRQTPILTADERVMGMPHKAVVGGQEIQGSCGLRVVVSGTHGSGRASCRGPA